MWDLSSRNRDRTHATVEAGSLNHWTTREVPKDTTSSSIHEAEIVVKMLGKLKVHLTTFSW